MDQHRKKWLCAAMGILIMTALFLSGCGRADAAASISYESKTLSNMCAYNGSVYSGAGGIYGEPVAVESSIFTIQDEQLYYVEKVMEAYESMTDEQLPLYRANLDGSGKKMLVDDVFLAGAGHEQVIGDKLFYVYGYDEEYRYQFASYDLKTGKRKEIQTNRIDHVLGYDGTYLYYSGIDTETQANVLGRIALSNNKDEIVFTGADIDEEGYIESAVFRNGSFYCLTLTEKTDSHDYRTYQYTLIVRDSKSGEVKEKLPIPFTGSANYSFYLGEDTIYCTIDGNVVSYPDNGRGEGLVMTPMGEKEYWGIIHFVPGDGYLYYEAIAETDEESGNNDYFYRVPVEGGEPELLKAWFTV